MHINWKVRLKNKVFWLTIIPAMLLLFQTVFGVFGLQISLDDLGDKLLDVVNAVFIVLALLGIVTDQTTEGLSDSKQALTYEKPKTKEGETI